MKYEAILKGNSSLSIVRTQNRISSIATLIFHCYLGKNREEKFIRIQISLLVVVQVGAYTIFQIFPLFTLCRTQFHSPMQLCKQNFDIFKGENWEPGSPHPKTRKFFHRYYLIAIPSA